MNHLRRLLFTLTGLHSHTWQVAPAEVLPNGRTVGPWLYCPMCGRTSDLLNEPPADHPESMTAELPREQEEWLAALDEELDPEGAR